MRSLSFYILLATGSAFAETAAAATDSVPLTQAPVTATSEQITGTPVVPVASKPVRQESAQTEYEQGLVDFNAGHIEFSIFAFERALAIDPDFYDARIAIIRAYIATAEYVAASTQLEFLDKNGQKLNEKQYAETSSLFQVTREWLSKSRRQLAGSISVAAGTDSNVNAGPDITSVTLPQLGVLPLNSGSQSVDDSFSEIHGNVQYTKLTESSYVLFVGAGFENRSYSKESDFDLLALRGFGGIIIESGDNQYKFNLMVQQYMIDGSGVSSSDQQQLGAQVQWKHRYSTTSSLSGFAQVASIAYPDQPVRDVSQIVAGAGWDNLFSQNIKFSSVLYTAVDIEADSNREDIGRSFSGIQLAVEAKTGAQSTLYSRLYFQTSVYGADDPAFQVIRDDTYIHAVLGWSRFVSDNWLLQPEARYSSKESNIPLNTFDRSQLMLVVKRVFK